MIEIWIDARSFGSKGSGFAIRLQSGKYDWIRTVVLGSITTNQAELKAFEYALKSVASAFIHEKVTIYTSNRYTILMLERSGDKWKRPASANQVLVEDVRKQYLRFREVVIYHDDGMEGSVVALLKQLNERAVKRGEIVFDKK
jgi:ribonuclease HI